MAAEAVGAELGAGEGTGAELTSPADESLTRLFCFVAFVAIVVGVELAVVAGAPEAGVGAGSADEAPAAAVAVALRFFSAMIWAKSFTTGSAGAGAANLAVIGAVGVKTTTGA